VDARAVRQARVEPGKFVVEDPANALGNIAGRRAQGWFANKLGGGRLQLAMLLNVNLPGPIDQNFGDVVVLQKLPDRLKEKH
jgi:hypothetical protein